MTAYKRALAILETEHEIVDVVFSYIDRMTDCENLEEVAKEFLKAVKPKIDKHLKAVRKV
jgi:hypothetical protein